MKYTITEIQKASTTYLNGINDREYQRKTKQVIKFTLYINVQKTDFNVVINLETD